MAVALNVALSALIIGAGSPALVAAVVILAVRSGWLPLLNNNRAVRRIRHVPKHQDAA
jgi:hypothetical protein